MFKTKLNFLLYWYFTWDSIFSPWLLIWAIIFSFNNFIDYQSEKITTLVKAANVEVESYWPSLFAKLCEKRNVEDLIMNVGAGGGAAAPVAAASAGGAAPAAEEKKEEKKVNFYRL